MERASTEQVYHVTRIAVDSYEDQVPTGWICNPYLEEALPFHGVTQLLIRMEALLDQLNFPQSFTKNRGMPRFFVKDWGKLSWSSRASIRMRSCVTP